MVPVRELGKPWKASQCRCMGSRCVEAFKGRCQTGSQGAEDAGLKVKGGMGEAEIYKSSA